MTTQITAVRMPTQLKAATITYSPVGTEVKQESVVLLDTFHLLCQLPGKTIESEMAEVFILLLFLIEMLTERRRVSAARFGVFTCNNIVSNVLKKNHVPAAKILSVHLVHRHLSQCSI